jgi:hypothetical protein
MLESAYHESLDLISQCMNTLQYCSSFDPVAEGYLAILQPIHLTLSTPETTASKRARMFRDPDTCETYSSNEVMLDHILELISAPYGGEANLMDHEFFSVPGNSANVSEHYRFMYPQQQQQQPQQAMHAYAHPRQGNHYQQSYYSDSRIPASPTRSRQDVTMGGTSEHSNGSPRQSRENTWTKEEYEAFFRRAA